MHMHVVDPPCLKARLLSSITIVTILVILAGNAGVSIALIIPKHIVRSDIVHEDWTPISVNFPVTFNRDNDKSNFHRRGASTEQEEPLLLTFSGYGREFNLELLVNDLLIARDAEFSIDGETVEIDRNKFQHGFMANSNDSRAHMFVDAEDEFVSGIIDIPTENVTFLIDRPENFILHKTPPLGTRMIMLRMLYNKGFIVNTGDSVQEEQNIIPNELDRRGFKDLLSKIGHKTGMKEKTTKPLCDLFMDADISFHKQWNGNNGPSACRRRRTFERMISYVNEVNGIYENNFDYFKLHIVGAEISSEDFIGDISDSTELLQKYQEWLPKKHRQGLQFDSVCLNHLFVHRQAGNILGQGIISRYQKGGICDTTAPNKRAQNVGFTTTLNDRGTVSYIDTIGTMAHEIGHNLGAIHDCCQDSEPDPPMEPTAENCRDKIFCHKGCSAKLYGERYCSKLRALNHKCVNGNHHEDHFLMYPNNSRVGNYNASMGIGSFFIFSSCSKRDIELNLGISGTCLHAPTNSNPCVDCTDPSLCPCCSGGQLVPTNSLCRKKINPCVERKAFCDGVSPFCPANDKKPDGTVCTEIDSGRKGICRKGKCDTPHKDFCATVSRHHVFNPCIHEDNQCIKTCISGNECVSVSEECGINPFVELRETCPYSDFETPCELEDGGDGICDGHGTCTPVSSDYDD